MRVLHVLDHSVPHHSGYSFRTLAILRGQRALGWETFHLTSPRQGEGRDEEEVAGFHFFRSPAAAGKTSGAWDTMRRTRTRLWQVAREIRPDLLHVHSPVLNAYPALSVARGLGVPVVYEVRAFWEDAAVDHGTTTDGSVRYRLSRALETCALLRACHVTTICRGLAADIEARGIDRERITVIPNGVDIRDFSPGGTPDEALKQALGLQGRTVLGFIGSFYAYEGLDLLIDALGLLRQEAPELALLLVGGGPQEARLRALAAQRGLERQVVFAGRVPPAATPRHYDLIDLLVYPRRAMRLTELVTPMKPLEAMAQGRLVLASDVGGHRELIEHGRTGLLFAPDSPEALAQAVRQMLESRHHWSRLRRNARAFVENERTWTASIARYRPVFESLVGRG